MPKRTSCSNGYKENFQVNNFSPQGIRKMKNAVHTSHSGKWWRLKQNKAKQKGKLKINKASTFLKKVKKINKPFARQKKGIFK